ncbi:hypothetical protein [Oscillibacter sp.]|uniref:hypothetical protein n=1 Tax=Oscillibacter sp. TaxID=1945593 RepID=UPI00261EA1A2|nr:hypothetical protein [Oscillibacter sp.]MDD3346874.1 hypothetical protein [Oscillibacter sp.]
MTYACGQCGFIFTRTGPVECCPACERDCLRRATAAEQSQLTLLLRREQPKQTGSMKR